MVPIHLKHTELIGTVESRLQSEKPAGPRDGVFLSFLLILDFTL